MGCVLSSPVELVRVQRHGSGAFRCAVAEMQGWRNGHEDAHEMSCGEKAGAFWVLDGHGGEGAAQYGAPALVKEFEELLSSGDALPANERIEQGLKTVDEQLRAYVAENPDKDSGSTVVGAFIAKQKDSSYTLKLINCGDSRAIVVRGLTEEEATAKPATLRVPQHLEELLKDPAAVAKEFAVRQCEWPLVQETVDHKPSHPTEKTRIEAAGGHVTEDEPPRLDGNLAVSRGLGDFEYKQKMDTDPKDQKVSCIPDIYEVSGLQPGSLCVLCCDGVWDVMSGKDVAEMVRKALSENAEADLGEIAASIVRTSLEKTSRDNVTAMVVQLSAAPEGDKDVVDEMKHFEKLRGEEPPEDDVRKQYINFLRKAGFPPEPCTCGNCGRWFISMNQCPCKQVYYCSRDCQKEGWRKHKSDCNHKKSNAQVCTPTSQTPKGGNKKK